MTTQLLEEPGPVCTADDRQERALREVLTEGARAYVETGLYSRPHDLAIDKLFILFQPATLGPRAKAQVDTSLYLG